MTYGWEGWRESDNSLFRRADITMGMAARTGTSFRPYAQPKSMGVTFPCM